MPERSKPVLAYHERPRQSRQPDAAFSKLLSPNHVKENRLNVFSIKTNPKSAITLTQKNYNEKTRRSAPYVVNDGTTIHSYALCPACQNPVTLVNRNVASTDSRVLYAKHSGRSVPGVADHDQAAYKDCPLHNPERFDSKTLRESVARNDEILNALRHHLHLVVNVLEKATGMKFTDALVAGLLEDFKSNSGHKYRAVTLYNLPFGFAYMTEGRDAWGCRVSEDIAAGINANSTGFEVDKYMFVKRKEGVKLRRINLYFDNHRVGNEDCGSDLVDLVVVEIDTATDVSTVLHEKTLSFDSGLFFNTYHRSERLRLLAQKHL